MTPAHLRLRAQLARVSWALHRFRVEKGLTKPMRKAPADRWLLISAPDTICAAQIFPFIFYAGQLRRAYGMELREITLRDFYSRAPYRNEVDVVCFQTWFDSTAEQMLDLVKQLKAAYPGAILVYLDWFAPTDLRFAEVLNPHVEFYVKKHLLRDRTDYARPTLGDSNLTDFYSRRLGPPLDPVVHSIPDGFQSKLIVGANFAFTPQTLPLLGRTLRYDNRTIDLHARIAVKGTPWYTAMRREALEAVLRIHGLRVLCRGRVSRRAYLRELSASRICFSPFGYGEVCWRDYEAVLSGALLVKQDMSHVETRPDIFRPFETYVPVSWDLSDLEEKVRYYIEHPEERIAIASRAFAVVNEYAAGGGFLDQMKPLFGRLKPAGEPSVRQRYARAG
jgi:hypothetical protein